MDIDKTFSYLGAATDVGNESDTDAGLEQELQKIRQVATTARATLDDFYKEFETLAPSLDAPVDCGKAVLDAADGFVSEEFMKGCTAQSASASDFQEWLRQAVDAASQNGITLPQLFKQYCRRLSGQRNATFGGEDGLSLTWVLSSSSESKTGSAPTVPDAAKVDHCTVAAQHANFWAEAGLSIPNCAEDATPTPKGSSVLRDTAHLLSTRDAWLQKYVCSTFRNVHSSAIVDANVNISKGLNSMKNCNFGGPPVATLLVSRSFRVGCKVLYRARCSPPGQWIFGQVVSISRARCLVGAPDRKRFDYLTNSYRCVRAKRSLTKSVAARNLPIGAPVVFVPADNLSTSGIGQQAVLLGSTESQSSADRAQRVHIWLQGRVRTVAAGEVYALWCTRDDDERGDTKSETENENTANTTSNSILSPKAYCQSSWGIIEAFCVQLRKLCVTYFKNMWALLEQSEQMTPNPLTVQEMWPLSKELQSALINTVKRTATVVTSIAQSDSRTVNTTIFTTTVATVVTGARSGGPSDLDVLVATVKGISALVDCFPSLRKVGAVESLISDLSAHADAVAFRRPFVGSREGRPGSARGGASSVGRSLGAGTINGGSRIVAGLPWKTIVQTAELLFANCDRRRFVDLPLKRKLCNALITTATQAFFQEFERTAFAGLAQAYWGDCKEYFKEQRPTSDILAWHTQCRSLWHWTAAVCDHKTVSEFPLPVSAAKEFALQALRATLASLSRLYISVKPSRARVRQYWLDIAYIVAATRQLRNTQLHHRDEPHGQVDASSGVFDEIDDYCVVLLAAMAFVCAPAAEIKDALRNSCCVERDSDASSKSRATEDVLQVFDQTLAANGISDFTAPSFYPPKVFSDISRTVEGRRADQWKRRDAHKFFELSWPWQSFLQAACCPHLRDQQNQQQLRPLLSAAQQLDLLRARPEFNSWTYSGVEYPPISCDHVDSAMMIALGVSGNELLSSLAAQNAASQPTPLLAHIDVSRTKEGESKVVRTEVPQGAKNLSSVLETAFTKYSTSLSELRKAQAVADTDIDRRSASKETDSRVYELWEDLCNLLTAEGVLG